MKLHMCPFDLNIIDTKASIKKKNHSFYLLKVNKKERKLKDKKQKNHMPKKGRKCINILKELI